LVGVTKILKTAKKRRKGEREKEREIKTQEKKNLRKRSKLTFSNEEWKCAFVGEFFFIGYTSADTSLNRGIIFLRRKTTPQAIK